MRQKAVVVAVRDSVATVEVLRSTMCEGCEKSKDGGACACGALLGANRSMRADAENPVGASVGDTVEVETDSRTVLGSAALVFLLPVVLALVFYLIAGRFTSSEAIALLAAGAGFALSLVPVVIVDRNRRGKPQLAVVGVLRGNDSEIGESSDGTEKESSEE